MSLSVTVIFASLQHAFSSVAMAIGKGISLGAGAVAKAAPVLQEGKPLVDVAVAATAGPGGLAAENAAYALLGAVAAEIHAQQTAGVFDPSKPLTVEHSAMLVQGVAALVPQFSAELAKVGVKVPDAVKTAAAVATAVTSAAQPAVG